MKTLKSREYVQLELMYKKLHAELEKHRWIPVSERLPRLNTKVWIHSTQLGLRTGKYTKNTKEWFFWDVDYTSLYVDVESYQHTITHWKPVILPEKP